MLIEVKNVAPDLCSEARIALKHLLEAHFHREHFVYIDQEPEAIVESDYSCLGEVSIAALEIIKQQYSEIASIKEILGIRAVVDFSKNNEYCRYDDRFSILHIPYRKLNHPSKVAKTKLVFEDEQEADFYEVMLKVASDYYLKREFINFEKIHGGGSRTFRTFNNHRKAVSPTLCIVDSDKKHPNDGRGSTAAHFPREPEQVDYWSKYIVLDCHEIENLVPLRILKNVVDSGVALAGISVLEKLSELDQSYMKFADLKSGLKTEVLALLDQGRSAFWTTKEVQQICESNPCGDFLVPPLGSDLLVKVVDHLSRTSAFKVREQLSEAGTSTIVDLLEDIRDWCFVNNHTGIT